MAELKHSKILIQISSNVFQRNYVETGIIEFLKKNSNQLLIYAHEDVVELPKRNVIRYSISRGHNNRHYQYLKALSWRYRHLSQTFSFRFKRTAQFKTIQGIYPPNYKLFFRDINSNFRSLIRRLKISIVGSRVFYPITKRYFENLLVPPKHIFNTLIDFKPNLVIIPSSSYDPAALDMINACKALNIKTLMLVDNWDNLSSKSVLWRQPDFVSVWGPQTKSHALIIQGFKAHQVFCVGTPRYEYYFRLRNKFLKSHFDFPYILFVGQSLPSDEIGVISLINSILRDQSRKNSKVKLVYRPHPWAIDQSQINLDGLENVIIDPQIIRKSKCSNKVNNFQPSLDYYPSLLKNSRFVISSLTSMLIEASIMRKHVIAICHKEPRNFTSPHRLLTEYEHFRGIEHLPNIYLSDSNQSLKALILELSNQAPELDQKKIDQKLAYFLEFNGTYEERLSTVIRSII